MTARPQLDERDPLPPPDWQPTSHAWARRQALEAAAAAVTAAREKRKKPLSGPEPILTPEQHKELMPTPGACRNCDCPWSSCLIHSEFCCDACSHPDGGDRS